MRYYPSINLHSKLDVNLILLRFVHDKTDCVRWITLYVRYWTFSNVTVTNLFMADKFFLLLETMLIKLTPYQDKGQRYIDNHIIDQAIMQYGIISPSHF